MALYVSYSFNSASVYIKLAFFFLIFALFAAWISFCTNNWGRAYPTSDDDNFVGIGVWSDARLTPFAANQSGVILTFRAGGNWRLAWFVFQAFATFGFISVHVGFLLIIISMCVPSCKLNADLAFRNGVNNIIGSICWIAAMIIFGVEFDDTYDYGFTEHQLHYSFALAIVSLIFQLMAGIVLVLVTQHRSGTVRESFK